MVAAPNPVPAPADHTRKPEAMPIKVDRDGLKRTALTMVIAAVGVLFFEVFNLPLPFLFGPMAACLIAALAGVRLKASKPFSVGARTILGVAIGASITPALLAKMPEMAPTLIMVPIYVAVIGAVGMPFFIKVFGYDRATAYFASMPGGLQDMVILGKEAGGNARSISLVQASRLLILTTVIPVLLSRLYGVEFNRPIGTHIWDMPIYELAVMAVAAVAGWQIAVKLRLFGASILGPFLLSGLLSILGVLHFRPPSEAILFAQFFVGTGIGVHYVGTTMQELRHDVVAGVAFALVLAVLTTIFTSIAHWVGGAPGVEAFLSFAPGGQAEMAVLAIVTGGDLGFVVLHHVARVVTVVVGAPVMAGRLVPGKDSE
jgi:membrane protein AbrB duplication